MSTRSSRQSVGFVPVVAAALGVALLGYGALAFGVGGAALLVLFVVVNVASFESGGNVGS